MSLPEVLFAALEPRLHQFLLEELRQSPPPFRFAMKRSLRDALPEIQSNEYHAAVLTVSRDEDLALALDVRRRRPDLPLYLLLPEGSLELQRQARQEALGTLVLQDGDARRTAARVCRLVATRTLRQEVRSTVAKTKALTEEVGRLAGSAQSILRTSQAARRPRPFATLVVEDDPDQALLTVRALLRAGVPDPIRVARDGDEAVAYLTGEGDYADRARFPSPSFILLDLHLPKRSGLEVLAWARAREALAEVPIVLFSSSDDPKHRDKAMALGAAAYLIKPHSPAGLAAIADRIRRTWVQDPP